MKHKIQNKDTKKYKIQNKNTKKYKIYASLPLIKLRIWPLSTLQKTSSPPSPKAIISTRPRASHASTISQKKNGSWKIEIENGDNLTQQLPQPTTLVCSLIPS